MALLGLFLGVNKVQIHLKQPKYKKMRTLILLFALLPTVNFLTSTQTEKKLILKDASIETTLEATADFGKTVCELNFGNYTLRINDYVAFADISRESSSADTIYLIEELETPMNIAGECTFEILGATGAVVSIEQSYQTSVFINDEGPHIELLDWKHHTSDWKKLDINEGKFQTLSYSDEDRQKFPKADLDEFKNYVKEIGGQRWFDVIKDNTSIAENGSYPTFIGITQHLFRVKIQPKEGQPTEQIFIIEVPLGC